MSYSTTENQTSVRILDAINCQHDQAAKAQADAVDTFMAAVLAGDVKAPAKWSGMGERNDYTVPGSPFKRPANVGDVLLDALDYSDFDQQAMQILIDAAKGGNVQAAAAGLIASMAAKWGWMNADKFGGE